jgi:hypothetical protein
VILSRTSKTNQRYRKILNWDFTVLASKMSSCRLDTWLHMPEAKWLEGKADHSYPLSVELKNMQSFNSKSHILTLQWYKWGKLYLHYCYWKIIKGLLKIYAYNLTICNMPVIVPYLTANNNSFKMSLCGQMAVNTLIQHCSKEKGNINL